MCLKSDTKHSYKRRHDAVILITWIRTDQTAIPSPVSEHDFTDHQVPQNANEASTGVKLHRKNGTWVTLFVHTDHEMKIG